ncbi:MAG: LPS export ABC transporter periplasmic protein LptC [Candidatus Puniceispirillaceae bacterium]
MADSLNTQQQTEPTFTPRVRHSRSESTRSWPISAVIGLFAVIALGGLGLWVLFFQTDKNISIDLNNVTTNQDGRLELQGLTYRGKTKAGDPFVMQADKASEDASNSDIVNLTVINGSVSSAQDGLITLQSDQGQFDQSQNFVSLQGNVVVTQSDRQLTFKTQLLSGDLTNGNFDAPSAVDLTSPTSQITGEAMTVMNFGKTISFKGKSKALIGEE